MDKFVADLHKVIAINADSQTSCNQELYSVLHSHLKLSSVKILFSSVTEHKAHRA